MIPQFRYLGVDPTLVNQIADWAKTIWPNADWDATRTATCAPYVGELRCSTEVGTSGLIAPQKNRRQ